MTHKILEHLGDELKTFDYTYEFSDDHRVWQRWTKKKKAVQYLINELAKIERVKVLKLINKYKSECGTQFSITEVAQ